jgi:hypothetical protein
LPRWRESNSRAAVGDGGARLTGEGRVDIDELDATGMVNAAQLSHAGGIVKNGRGVIRLRGERVALGDGGGIVKGIAKSICADGEREAEENRDACNPND